ncbi:hypothetical protein H0901_18165 [Microcystis aeruginosa BLCCF158]|uniref:Uncharacterized protein n=1 Tax=Microcystis aeruginosa BLCC-F158 TaxID=2755316 RepID=A0A841V4H5_MICAE|nr:hypothetical protein [Microcystis aeruginosa]MBC1197118.1 hypothetical protein [Microcystis aeruginosa BLCC-F158]
MEPVSLIIAALTAGAVAAAKDTAEKGVKDTYQGLKTLIKRKFANDALAQAMVEAKPEDIKKAEGLLKDKIVEAGVDKDNEITKLAQDLLDKLQEQPGGQQIITQNISNVKYAASSNTGNASISGITEHGTSKDD